MRLSALAVAFVFFVAGPAIAQTDNSSDTTTQLQGAEQAVGQAAEDVAVAADDLVDTASENIDQAVQDVSQAASDTASEGETFVENAGSTIDEAASEHAEAAQQMVEGFTWEQGFGLGTGILAGALIADLLGGGGLVTLGASSVSGWLGYTLMSP